MKFVLNEAVPLFICGSSAEADPSKEIVMNKGDLKGTGFVSREITVAKYAATLTVATGLSQLRQSLEDHIYDED